MCKGCDGKKLVNYVKLKPNEIFTDETKTTIRKCLICKGVGMAHRNKSKKRLNKLVTV
jgi:hypothetical protein